MKGGGAQVSLLVFFHHGHGRGHQSGHRQDITGVCHGVTGVCHGSGQVIYCFCHGFWSGVGREGVNAFKLSFSGCVKVLFKEQTLQPMRNRQTQSESKSAKARNSACLIITGFSPNNTNYHNGFLTQ